MAPMVTGRFLRLNGLFFPASLSGQPSDVLALFRREMLCSGFAALHSACTSFALWRISLRLADRILSFANGDVEHLLGKLDGIARTFAHEASMPQSQPSVLCVSNRN